MQTQEKHSQAAVLGLQHLLAMYSGSILVPIMIATALGYSAEQLTYLISTDIFMCGVATFLQLQLNKYFGIGLPVVLGVAFQSVAPLIMIGQSHGSGAMFGALIASGIYVIHLYQRIYQVYLYFDWSGCWNCHRCYYGLGGLLSCCSSTAYPCPNSPLLWNANL